MQVLSSFVFLDTTGAGSALRSGRRQAGNKAFTIRENTYQVEADVAPFFEFRRYGEDGTYRAGVALVPDNGRRIENFPERLTRQRGAAVVRASARGAD